MPRCQGLPTGPCPAGVNDRSVKNSIADLFLCPSCDEARFPTATKGKGKGIKSTKRTNQNSPALSAPDDNVQCAGCDRTCARTASLKCDICCDFFDQQCTLMPNNVFSTIQSIVEYSGWVCPNCRLTCKEKFDKLQVNQSVITDKVATLTIAVEEVCGDVKAIDDKLKQLSHDPATPKLSSPNSELSDTAIKSCIVKTVQDISRRDSNVVVTGLPEEQDVLDETVFSTFCEENLSIKPSVVSCRRLGKSVNNRAPRRLLVKLRSAEVASELRRSSRSLRNSIYEVVRSVYINPDLTREQAQLAYEHRQKRRAARMQQSSTTTSTVPSGSLVSSGSNDDPGVNQQMVSSAESTSCSAPVSLAVAGSAVN